MIRSAPISTLAGSGPGSGYADGNSTYAQFFNPLGASISSDGVFALVADFNNRRVRRVTMSTGMVTTLAGSGANSNNDGTGTSASFSGPYDVSISRDASFALVVDQTSHRVRRIQIATGVVTTLAGSSAGFADGMGTLAAFYSPYGVAVSPDASFALVADCSNHRIRLVTIATGSVTTLAGSTQGYADATGTSARFKLPSSVAISSDGTFALVPDSGNQRVRRVDIATGVVRTLAGSGSAGSADGAGALASFDGPFGVAISPDASYALVTNTGGCKCVRHIAVATGVVTTMAMSAPFNVWRGVTIAPDGASALVMDLFKNCIRRATLASPCQPGYYCAGGSYNMFGAVLGKSAFRLPMRFFLLQYCSWLDLPTK